MLTDRFIRSAKPGTYADEGGLYLRVFASSKAFLWRRRKDGRDKWETLGHYPTMSLLEARDKLQRLKAGHVERTVAESFSDYYEHLTTEFVDPAQTKRMFDKEIMPLLGSRNLDDIDKSEWTERIKAIVRRGSPVMANRVLTQVKRFLSYCEQNGWVRENPLERVQRRAMGGREKPKDRNLSLDEIETFLAALPTWGVSDGTKWALAGCLLTGLRATEVLTLDGEGATFTKLQRWHKIPQTRLVKLWMSKRPPELPRDHRVLSHALRREGQTFTPHDLRRTYASRLADLGATPHVIEKLLDHRMVGVMAVYNRAEYWPERIAAQRLWDKTVVKKMPRN